MKTYCNSWHLYFLYYCHKNGEAGHVNASQIYTRKGVSYEIGQIDLKTLLKWYFQTNKPIFNHLLMSRFS